MTSIQPDNTHWFFSWLFFSRVFSDLKEIVQAFSTWHCLCLGTNVNPPVLFSSFFQEYTWQFSFYFTISRDVMGSKYSIIATCYLVQINFWGLHFLLLKSSLHESINLKLSFLLSIVPCLSRIDSQLQWFVVFNILVMDSFNFLFFIILFNHLVIF